MWVSEELQENILPEQGKINLKNFKKDAISFFFRDHGLFAR